MMYKASEFVKFLESKVGTNYVYGMKGNVLTEDKFKQLQKQHTSQYVWDSDKSKIGTVCVDCSGLYYWYTGFYLNSNGLRNDAVYKSNNFNNIVVGATVWRQGHVGFYVGNGKIVEAKGSKDNTVISKLENQFTEWFKQSGMIYDVIGDDVDNDIDYPGTEINYLTYSVIKGDNLTKIASKFNTSVDEIIDLNCDTYPSLLKDKNTIMIGWKFKIKTDSENRYVIKYTVVKGDSLSKIAKNNNTTVQNIINDNKSYYPSLVSRPDLIQQGWTLIIK